MSHSNFDHRHYVIISSSDVPNIDFTQVMETSADTLRLSLDETLTFVKYEGDAPSFLRDKPTLTQTEMIEELEKSEWDIDDGNNN